MFTSRTFIKRCVCLVILTTGVGLFASCQWPLWQDEKPQPVHQQTPSFQRLPTDTTPEQNDLQSKIAIAKSIEKPFTMDEAETESPSSVQTPPSTGDSLITTFAQGGTVAGKVPPESVAASTSPEPAETPAAQREAEIEPDLNWLIDYFSKQKDVEAAQTLAAKLKTLQGIIEKDALPASAGDPLFDRLLDIYKDISRNDYDTGYAKAETLLNELKEKTNLKINALNYIIKVEAFGDYKLYTGDFYPTSKVLIYFELENFSTEKRGYMYRSNIEVTLSILDEAGQAVLKKTIPDVHESKSDFRDFFFPIMIDLAEGNFFTGSYTVKITVVDKIKNFQTEQTLPLIIK